jgi:hypothetical protein
MEFKTSNLPSIRQFRISILTPTVFQVSVEPDSYDGEVCDLKMLGSFLLGEGLLMAGRYENWKNFGGPPHGSGLFS